MSKNNWTEDQLKAIKKRESNILVSASAGSGKTAVLVERIIRKIIEDKVDIDKILVVTFTNSAASEMRERILDAIYKKISDVTISMRAAEYLKMPKLINSEVAVELSEKEKAKYEEFKKEQDGRIIENVTQYFGDTLSTESSDFI